MWQGAPPTPLAKGKAETAQFLIQNRVKAAWLRRWSCVLACSAVYLLEQRPNFGTGGDTLSEHEVVRDACFVEPGFVVCVF